MLLPRFLDPRSPRTLLLWGLAALFTLANAPKPLLIDDSAYYCYARQIAHDPLHPYGFEMFWWQWPEPANEVLAPPVLPYWWSVPLRLFGDDSPSFLWKLWLFPFSLLFVVALHALLRRFARGVEVPVLLMTVLSPTFLPSLNLMLDVPALALSLGAIAVFLRAFARESLVLAALAGLLAGLAMETKYTAFLAPAVMLLYIALFSPRLVLALFLPVASFLRSGRFSIPRVPGVVFGRLLVGFFSVGVAVALFVTWELFVATQHGESHFRLHARAAGGSLWDKGALVGNLITILGAITPPITLLGLAGLGLRRRWLLLVGAVLASGFVAVASWTTKVQLMGRHADLDFAIYFLFGVLLLVTLGVIVGCLFARVPFPAEKQEDRFIVVRAGEVDPDPAAPGWWVRCAAPFRRLDWFLLFWLLGEMCGYYVLTPFPAVRRVMGIIIVATLIAARLAARTATTRNRQAAIWGVAAAGIAWGLLFYGVDMCEAFAEKHAVEDAAAFIQERDPDATVWYVGHWGFQHYAERAGWQPVVPTPRPGHSFGSVLRRGDWLVKPDWNVTQQVIRVDKDCTEEVAERFSGNDGFPLRTVIYFYAGDTPLKRDPNPRVPVVIYRVTADHYAESP